MKKYANNFLNYIKKGLAVLLCFLLQLPLFGCAERRPTVQSGVLVTPTVARPYSTETEEYAKETIYGLLAQYFQKTVTQTLPEPIIQKLREQAVNIQKITADTKLTEVQYLQGMQFLRTHIEDYTDALARLEKGESIEEDFKTLKHVYTNLASKFGADTLGAIVYTLYLYYYDYEYETCMASYEKYGYAYLKADAEALAREKKTLQEEVGQENFISAMQMICLLSDLFFGDFFVEGKLVSFTDHELLALLQEPSFSSITISAKGWELLLKNFQTTVTSEGYFGKLFAKACENGDVALLSAQMGNVLKLFSAVQKDFTVEQVALFKQNKKKQGLSSVISSWDAKEWALFEAITTLELKKADYEEIAEGLYGESYKNYRSTVKTSSLDELKNAAGTDTFLAVLESYLAGISPAISYGFTL